MTNDINKLPVWARNRIQKLEAGYYERLVKERDELRAMLGEIFCDECGNQVSENTLYDYDTDNDVDQVGLCSNCKSWRAAYRRITDAQALLGEGGE